MVDKVIFLMMIAIAIFMLISHNLKRIIVALGLFSLLAAFCYLIYHAPDVAVAEAVIGSALSTILYIVALKKHRTFYVYFTAEKNSNKSDVQLRADMEDVVSKIMQYCAEHDLEAQAVFTWDSPESIADEHLYDIILQGGDNKVTVYGSEVEKHVVAIKGLLMRNFSKERLAFSVLNEEDVT